MKRIYLDHAAGTPLDPRVKEIMEPYLIEEFGNPGGLYREGRRAKDAIENARETVAGVLNCSTNEIVFTSGGTEGDVMALVGTARAYAEKGKHIISTTIQHHAAFTTLLALPKKQV